MKIVVTYEEADIVKMVQRRLAKRGIVAAVENITFKKNAVVVSVDNVDEGDVDDDAVDEMQMRVAEVAPSTQPPPLVVVDGGNAPFDMDAIRRESAKHAAANPGKFPLPERQLMDGESFDYPGGTKS